MGRWSGCFPYHTCIILHGKRKNHNITKQSGYEGMRKKLAMLLTATLLASVLTACTKSEDKKEDLTPSSTGGTEAQQTEEPAASPNGDVTKMKADIVVIGAGGAGMTAAIQATQDGATNVVIVEKMPQTGGNTTYATGGLNASETKYQKKKGIKDSNELFYEDTMKAGKNLNDKELVRTLANNSNAAVEWINSIGGDLSVVAMLGGASVERAHRPSDTSAVGPMLVKTFNAQIDKLGIPVLLNTTAEEIQVDEKGAITGVKIKGSEGEQVIECKAVVLATGGFGANPEMVKSYRPDLEGFASTNQSGATGDGIKMATAVGAALVDMNQIQTHPTVDPETHTLFTEGVRGNGAILINSDGKRFVNELETRDVVSAAILEQPNGYAYMIFDDSVRKSLSAIEKYVSAGLVIEADTLDGLAKKIDVDKKTLKATMKAYEAFKKAGKDKDFGRKDLPEGLTNGPYYAVKCSPAVHHTMGGVKINTSAEVVNKDGIVIPGLYAAGEVTGGVHGGNRLGGNAVADITVFGRIAGSSAEQYVKDHGGNTERTISAPLKIETPKATPEVKGNYKDGLYTGTGTGNNGEIKVRVTVKDGSITDIEVMEQKETENLFESAKEGVLPEIIRTQKLEVDTVAGATHSSQGLMEAVRNALDGAQQ